MRGRADVTEREPEDAWGRSERAGTRATQWNGVDGDHVPIGVVEAIPSGASR